MRSVFIGIPAILLPALLSVGGLRQSPTKVALGVRLAYVSSQRLSSDSLPGKAGVARVQALQQERTTELRSKQQALESTRRELTLATDPSRRALLQQQEQQQRADLERGALQAQADIQNLQRQIGGDLTAKVKLALDDLLKDSSVELVVQAESTVIWSAPGHDLTPLVIERLDAEASKP